MTTTHNRDLLCGPHQRTGHPRRGPAAPHQSDRLTTVLRARGWTDAAIRRFLGEPDATARNPWRSSAPLRLYDPARVAVVEASPEWRVWQAGASKRRAAARAAAQRRRQQTVAEIATLTIRVARLPREELERRAVSHRNARAAERDARCGCDAFGSEPATVEAVDPSTLQRWCVNWLRHQGTRYDWALQGLYARVGRREATRLLRTRVYEAIGRAYPWLAAEAGRQQTLRETGEE